MPDQLATKQLQELRSTGWTSEETSTRAPKCWWLRADGSLLPNKLPIDPYHMDRFIRRGWKPLPPHMMVVEVDGKLEISAPEFNDGEVVPAHTHRYAKALGSPCGGMTGCPEVRTTPYRRRKAHIAEEVTE
jgi:hypothetical protein